MKAKVIILTVVCVGLLGGCKGYYHCKPKKAPANLKPISCENFNNVTTIYWDLYRDCEEIYYQEIKPPCDTLLVEGWGYKGGGYIFFCPDSISAANQSSSMDLRWSAIGTEENFDHYYIVCTSIKYNEYWKARRYSIELIGYRIYPETENKTGR